MPCEGVLAQRGNNAANRLLLPERSDIVSPANAPSKDPNFVLDVVKDSEQAEPVTEDPVVAIAVVTIRSESGEPLPQALLDDVYGAIAIKAGGTATRSSLQADINSIYTTGLFANVRAVPENTEAGVEVIFYVEPNPVLTQVQVVGRQVLPEQIIDEAFSDQYGQILDLGDFQAATLVLDNWYKENGYVLANILGTPQVEEDGTVVITVAEGKIEAVEFAFTDEAGETTDEIGNPISGEIHDSVIAREMETQLGDIFQNDIIQQDLERIFSLGVFSDVQLKIDPGYEDPRNVRLVISLTEGEFGSFGASAGFNIDRELLLEAEYQDRNFASRAQSVLTKVALSPLAIELDLSTSSSGTALYTASDESAIAREIAETAKDEETIDDAIEKTKQLLALFRGRSENVKVALTLNNLGNLHLRQREFDLALGAFQEANAIFQALESPGLALLTHLNSGIAYKATGQADSALAQYKAALIKLNMIKKTTDLSAILGDEVLGALSPEWGIEQPVLDNRIASALPLVENALLLSIADIQSATGNYQQAIYTANAPQFFAGENTFGQTLVDLSPLGEVDITLDPLKNGRKKESDESAQDVATFLLDLVTEESANYFKELAVESINNAPIVVRAVALQSIYKDLETAAISNDQYSQATKAYLLSEEDMAEHFGGLTELLNDPSFLQDSLSQISLSLSAGIDRPEDKEKLQQGLEKLAVWFREELFEGATETTAERESTANIVQEIAPVIEVLSDFLTDKVLSLSDSVENDPQLMAIMGDIADVDDIEQLLGSAIKTITKYALASDGDREEAYDDIIELSQRAIALWPEDHKVLGQLEWIPGYFYQIQGRAHLAKGNDLAAIEAYRSSAEAFEKGASRS